MSETVVTGASSQVGLFLLPKLDRAGHAVRAVSRRAPAELSGPESALQWVSPGFKAESARALVSCGPLDLARRFLARSGSFRKAVVFSTTSVLTKRSSGNRAEREQIGRIAAEEDSLRELCGSRGVELVLLRPTLVYGCGLDRNVSLLLKLGERTGFIPLSANAEGLRQPVHAADLAQLAFDCLRADTGPYFEGAAPGGETLAYREMVCRVGACGKGPIRLLPLPPALLGGFVQFASVIGPWKGVNPEMVHRQAIDMVFEAPSFPAPIRWNPRPFKPTPSDFHIPPELESYSLSSASNA